MRSFSTSYEHVILISMACGCSSQLILLTDQATLIVGNQRSRRVGATCFDIAHCLRYVMSFWPFKTLTYCKATTPVSYTHLRAHETGRNLVCRLLLEKKKNQHKK